jgi:hypothetical protein
MITRIAWTHGTPCETGSRDVTITVEATASSALTYSGMLGDCDGQIDAATKTVTGCSGASPMIGTVTVTDEDSRSDTQPFTVPYCTDGAQLY